MNSLDAQTLFHLLRMLRAVVRGLDWCLNWIASFRRGDVARGPLGERIGVPSATCGARHAGQTARSGSGGWVAWLVRHVDDYPMFLSFQVPIFGVLSLFIRLRGSSGQQKLIS